MRAGTAALTIVYLFTVQPDAQSSQERFALYSSCQPMDLVVEDLRPDAAEIGLTTERLQVASESRLRSARLFLEGAFRYLYININVVGPAFSWTVRYTKYLRDEASGTNGLAGTWSDGGVGTHGGDASYILQAVSESVDRFLVEYLRVNEDACGA